MVYPQELISISGVQCSADDGALSGYLYSKSIGFSKYTASPVPAHARTQAITVPFTSIFSFSNLVFTDCISHQRSVTDETGSSSSIFFLQ